jgi:superoxide dismutase
MSTAALGVQGSGWAWLGYSKASKGLEIVTCANQDPLVLTGHVPLLGIDVWEHAYCAWVGAERGGRGAATRRGGVWLTPLDTHSR